MTGMHILRNRCLRRWIAGGLAVTWLFTVLACAVDTDAVAADETPVPQLASPDQSRPAHHHDNGTQDDPCCRSQASTITSFSPVKLPQVTALSVIVPVALLIILALPLTLLGMAAAPDRYAVRRRSVFLIHSLQAQAPPR